MGGGGGWERWYLVYSFLFCFVLHWVVLGIEFTASSFLGKLSTPVLFLGLFCFETGSPHVAQIGLQLSILLFLTPRS
jgi:hypothetical protein